MVCLTTFDTIYILKAFRNSLGTNVEIFGTNVKKCVKMSVMNIAIVDDMPPETDRLSGIINEYAYDNHMSADISSFSSAEDLLADYRPLQYTLIFMDIYMNGMTGIDAARKIRENDPDTLIVFLTTSPDHAFDAFDVHAYQYLIKAPHGDDDSLRASVFKILDEINSIHSEDATRLTFYVEGSKQSVSYAYIVYVQSQKNYIQIMDRSSNCHRARMTFSEVSDILKNDIRFLQINRGIIINMDYITSFEHNVCCLTGGYKFPINVREQKRLDQIRKNYIFTKLHNSTSFRGQA